MKKILSVILVALQILCICSLLAGCGEKQSIYFLNFKPESADVYREIAKAYEKETEDYSFDWHFVKPWYVPITQSVQFFK